MANLKILPCPFCGKTPTIQPWHGGAPTKMLIGCENEECQVQPNVTGETKDEAVARWQKRNPDYRMLCGELANRVIWALKFLKAPGAGLMSKGDLAAPEVKLIPWQEDFMDALDLVGWKIDRKKYWEQKEGKKGKR